MSRTTQAYDNFGHPVTTFAEGGPQARLAVPADGKWHRLDLPAIPGPVRLHVLPGRNGILYATSGSAPGFADQAAIGPLLEHSDVISAGRTIGVFPSGPLDLFVAADPDGTEDAPVVVVTQSAVGN